VILGELRARIPAMAHRCFRESQKTKGLEGANKEARRVRVAARGVLPVGTVLMRSGGCGDVALESFGDLLFWHGAYNLLDDLAVFEDEQGRDAANVIAAG
jgi:hypothetical protein